MKAILQVCHLSGVILVFLAALHHNAALRVGESLVEKMAGSWNVTGEQSVVQCEDITTSGKRVLLLSVTAPYHGSTSILQLMMSSPDVSNLCSYGENWQCDGMPIMRDEEGWSDDIDDWHGWQKPLQHFSKYWNLNSPVLLEKSPNLIHAIEDSVKELSSIELPELMRTAGVEGLELAYIITWRPPCLSPLSSHSYERLEHGSDEWIHHEELFYKQLVDAHKLLLEMGVPTLLINVADTLWRQDETLKRVQDFLPCVSGLGFDYMPEMGKDIFHGNHWKLESTLKSYGESVDPVDCCGYDVVTTECLDVSKWPPLEHALSRSSFIELISYLHSHS